MNYFKLPLEEWTNTFINDWFLPNMSGFFDGISNVFQSFIDMITKLLIAVPPEIIAIILIILAWRISGKGLALFTLVGCLYMGSVGMWEAAMQTVGIMIVSTIVSVFIGVPLGILSETSKGVDKVIRPILDFMQTLPIFVYLIPSILLFGLGGVPAVIATFVFAAPPAVRMTSLGIKQVPAEVVEASKAFGSTTTQLLFKVQLPLAMPAIMAGVNQTIMLSLSMAVVSSMIGAPGLGSSVLRGIATVNVGLGLTAGLAIVVLAIILDRITQSLGQKTKF
ncbi:ABC transporter permease [Neobacillus rhizophilus]|uniref:Proline/glycine betaine ABC transporter permease n=1 Tax=Neobacillus rhizophilus TaxID=2833579 RepID=A0A942U2B5_9BACI|nr:proline/glycine betaine ABC transporter permease [Neobacillus rhizophilus]MBS4210977.1 proline/glycine betaine ABC transporter permease [Neobacillus rhizophilus]